MKMIRPLVLSIAVLFAQAVADPPDEVVDGISADSLRGHLSFIASDLLEGRGTPSPGLDIAAEYIAAQFRRAGLEAIGDDGYFQTTTMQADDPTTAEFSCTVSIGGSTFEIPASRISVMAARDDVDITDAPLAALAFPEGAMDALAEHPTVIVTSFPSPQSLPRDEIRAFFQDFNAFIERIQELKGVVILNLDPDSETGTRPGAPGRFGRMAPVPIFTIHGRELAEKFGYDAEEEFVGRFNEPSDRVDLHYKRPVKRDFAVRNVAGLLRGSDPDLSDTYIIVTAHYDHIGRGTPVNGDDIYNGANDDGSGTVSVIELASALARLPERAKRSILFMCFFGEERGLVGSRHYINNPLVPLEKTIANVNLEHVGRTDDVEGESIARLMPTGFGYSSLVDHFIKTAGEVDVEVYNHPRNSAAFFPRSDNIAFANAGIPAHTFCTAFIFPDYHEVEDHWDKIDYDNLAKVNRALALGILDLANDPSPPVWNEDHRATGRYVRAWRTLHGIAAGQNRDDD